MQNSGVGALSDNQRTALLLIVLVAVIAVVVVFMLVKGSLDAML